VIADWRFNGSWRRYQQLALDAFERDRLAARDRTLLVAPPGSGKTIVGLEIVRRIGEPALVLCPSQTIQRQWGEKQALFGGASDDLHLLTYQSLCQADDPDGMLREVAQRHWVAERAATTGTTVDEVAAEAAAWSGSAAERRELEVGRIVARLKKQAASGKLPEVPRDELLSATARARLRTLADAGVRTVVLDECHHLASLWGALLAGVLEELSPRHVLGLTATNPQDLTPDEAALYRSLLDEVDMEVPTPAVVREGHLAPYQELVQLCEPLSSERDWLAERHFRFEEVLLRLSDVAPGAPHLGLAVWLVGRLRERRSAAGGELSWTEFARRSPRLADAGLRWLHSVGEALPPDAPRGERTRAPLSIDDWIVLLDDYALRCLRADPSDEAVRRFSELQLALSDLGFTMTRTGIRRTGGEVDRVLLSSAAKPIAMCDLLDAEYESRGDALCAVVLCDTERAPRQPDESPLTLSGGARGLLAAVAADVRFPGVHPAMVTASTFAVAPDDVEWWLERLPPGLATVPEDGIVVLRGEWDSRVWVGVATELLSRRECKLLVGTRGLLGEGWDCPQVNVLVDMTSVAADVSVRQMRGRSLRLDPGDPTKLANNWDVVCVAPDLERGHADYGRFIRRHAHLHAPCEDGTIESGPSHVHPALSPFGPPPAAELPAINIEQRLRAQQLEEARARWQVGTPYRGVDLDAVVVRRPARAARAPDPLSAGVGVPIDRGLVARLASTFGGRARLYPTELPLEWAAGAVCDAYVSLGELTPDVAASLTFAVRPEGWVRVALPAATPEASALVSGALDELIGGAGLPRYTVSRRALAAGAGGWSRPATVWHGVPSDLARRKDRAEAFRLAWSRWAGPSTLVYAHSGDEGAALAAEAAAGPVLETQRRRVWL
jgi:superfamily II DNA or RNA helicase